MKISVVTNAFNQAEFLPAAVESVLGQQGAEIEYVIVDPGSSDGTPAVIEQLAARYPGCFTVLRDPDEGPADGLNKAFAQCSGDWFIYLNADDVFLTGAFEQAVLALQCHADAGAVIGSGYLVDAAGRYIRRAISTPFAARSFVYGGSFALQQSTFYRAAAFRAVAGFNVANRTSWDAEILFDMERAGLRLATVPGYWSLFRMQPNSITVSQRWADESKRTHARYFREIMARDPDWRDRLLRKFGRYWFRLVRPRATMARLIDHLAPSRQVFKEALSPEWFDAGH